MDKKKIAKLQRRLATFLQGKTFKSKQIHRFAERCGYKSVNRGSEPTYEHQILHDEPPLTIPHHSKELRPATAKNVLLQIGNTLFNLEEEARNREESKGGKS